MIVKTVFLFFVVLAVPVVSGCRSSENQVTQESLPQNLQQAVLHDQQRNLGLEISSIGTMAKDEALSRRRFYDADARLNAAETAVFQSISGDPRFYTLDNAAACAAVTLDPAAVKSIAKERRYESVVKSYSYFDYYRKLERYGVITSREQEDSRIFLMETEISQGFSPAPVLLSFDFSTLPQADGKSYLSALPEWMKWDVKTPLLWTKLLLMLPQETARTVDLDHSKLAAKVMEISRAVKSAMAFEYVRKLRQKQPEPDDVRGKIRRELDLRLAAGIMAQVKERTPELSREEDFIRDLYILMQ
jgi:hypothetical protein